MIIRIVLAAAGVALGLYGIGRLLTSIPPEDLVILGVWLVAAVAIHDGVLSPLVLSAGWLLARTVPARARRYLQAALIMAGLVTVIAIPMILRQFTEPPAKAILLQDFRVNLAILLGVIAGASLLLYAVRVARDSIDASPTKRP